MAGMKCPGLGNISRCALVPLLLIYAIISMANGSIYNSTMMDIIENHDNFYRESEGLFILMPNEGPNGTTIMDGKGDQTISSNAIGQAGRKFFDPKNNSRYAFIGISKTIGEPYWHDYSVCNRYKGGTLENISLIQLPIDGNDTWFWLASSKIGKETNETITFAVFVDEKNSTYRIYSRWIYENYPHDTSNKSYRYILNYQIQSDSSMEAKALLQKALDLLHDPQKKHKVYFDNTKKPVIPQIYIKSAKYNISGVWLELVSSMSGNTSVQIDTKWYNPDNTSQ